LQGCGVGEKFRVLFWEVLLLAEYCVANQYSPASLAKAVQACESKLHIRTQTLHTGITDALDIHAHTYDVDWFKAVLNHFMENSGLLFEYLS
jgi:hypothetical protein